MNMSKAMRMSANTRMMRQGLLAPRRGEEGIALVTTLVILLIMTVLGVGAVATTALENRIAGFQRTGESANSAAEACVGTSANIIKQTIAAGNVACRRHSMRRRTTRFRPWRHLRWPVKSAPDAQRSGYNCGIGAAGRTTVSK